MQSIWNYYLSNRRERGQHIYIFFTYPIHPGTFIENIILHPLHYCFGHEPRCGLSNLVNWLVCVTLGQFHEIFITGALWWGLFSGTVNLPALLFLFSCLRYPWPFAFPYEVSNQLVNFSKKKKKSCWDFDWDSVNL